MDNPAVAEKNWICISLDIIGRAVGFFLESRMMEGLNADYGHVIGSSDPRQPGVDYLAESLMTEMKCSFAGLNGLCLCRSQKKVRSGLMPDTRQILDFIDLSSSMDYRGQKGHFTLDSAGGAGWRKTASCHFQEHVWGGKKSDWDGRGILGSKFGS